MKLKFIELELEWPSTLSVFDLKEYIQTKLKDYGEPLRWAITSLTTHSEKKIQIMSIEVVLIINQDERKDIDSYLS